jgi:glycosyltransferase involved in cell wall biosynthesis
MANSGWSWHLFAAPAILIGKLRGIAVVVNYRGGEADSFLARSVKQVKRSLARADALVVPSGFLETVFAKYGFTSRIVPNIIDLGRFSPREAGVSSAPNILVARNLEPIYDNATALRAFKIVRESLPAARLTIAGSGPEKAMLHQLAAELGIAEAVTFAGRVENADMPKLYRSADVMINPSLADNMPISVLESLASGVPVVSTNVGGVAYLVKDGETALLVPPGDHAAMAAALLRLLREAELAHRLSAAGLAEVRQYAWPNVRERLFSVYQDVLAGAQR